MIWWLLTLVTAGGMLLAADGSKDVAATVSSPILGQWANEEIGISFNADGTFFSQHADGRMRSGRYSASNTQLLIQPTDFDTPKLNLITVVGNTLTITNPDTGTSDVFTRV